MRYELGLCQAHRKKVMHCLGKQQYLLMTLSPAASWHCLSGHNAIKIYNPIVQALDLLYARIPCFSTL